jgi:peptidoglycan-N-acetylglucosamine deacetylase
MGPENTSLVMTRRVLLTVAGATLLSVWTADPVRPGIAAPRPPDPRQARAGRAGQADSLASRDHPASGRRPPGPHAPPQPAGRASDQPQLAAARRAKREASQVPMTSIDDGSKAIALTIDDGPNPIYTPQVLRLLARYRVTATFSMIGIEAQAYPAVAREVADAGHLLTNHTWTHLNLAWLAPAAVTEQMSRGTDAIHAATGRVPDLFRAPYGAWSPFVLSQCARSGMTPLGWSVDPRDWSRPGVAPIVANIMRNTHTGCIILEHDGGGDRSQTVAALKIVIPRLLAAGYRFRTP